ncbi:MAG: GNAT family N-acetyltransferase [Candidatus Melainabacteria bacterium]|nr:GNAT family N-acetyltransferase [Candidatus Melainabacteria bacterium]
MIFAMMTIIREMNSADLGELATGYVQAVYRADEPWTDEAACALLTDWLQRQPDLAFVAQVDGKLAGAIMVGIRPWWDGNHLVDGELFVRPEYQRKGIAAELMRVTINTAIAKYKPVVWETYTFRAQNFPLDWYQKLGFREINEWMMIRAEIKQLSDSLVQR